MMVPGRDILDHLPRRTSERRAWRGLLYIASRAFESHLKGEVAV